MEKRGTVGKDTNGRPAPVIDGVRLDVGDPVVYGAYGVGEVALREQRVVLGAECEVVVLEFAAGLRVTLPVEQARERLRAVAGDADLQLVEETLAREPAPREPAWTRRIKEGKAKLAGGSAVELAEIVRDGLRSAGGAGKDHKLSPGERQVYLQARQLLSREICSAWGLGQEEAEQWIDGRVSIA